MTSEAVYVALRFRPLDYMLLKLPEACVGWCWTYRC